MGLLTYYTDSAVGLFIFQGDLFISTFPVWVSFRCVLPSVPKILQPVWMLLGLLGSEILENAYDMCVCMYVYVHTCTPIHKMR